MKKLIYLIICFMLIACGQAENRGMTKTPTPSDNMSLESTLPSNTQEQCECVAPLTQFAYPWGDAGLPAPQNQPDLLPQKGWELVSTIPEYTDHMAQATLDLELFRQNNGNNEIWIKGRDEIGFYIYHGTLGTWEKNDKNNAILVTSFLFTDKKNSVWAAKRQKDPKVPLLSKYDEITKQFIPVIDKDGLFTNQYLIIQSNPIKVDSSGVFWMIVEDNSDLKDISYLISFDPDTMVATRHLSDPGLATSLEITSDNTILLVDENLGEMIQYSPKSDKITNTNIPDFISDKNINPGTSLFLDHNRRLWLNESGYFDMTDARYPQWYVVIRSPIFIDFIEAAGMWGWGSPFFVENTSDGLLWYRASRGTGWLDPQQGKWCLFTSYRSNIVQDNEHNLWILIDGSLYKHPYK